jgi:hypothetical protein
VTARTPAGPAMRDQPVRVPVAVLSPSRSNRQPHDPLRHPPAGVEKRNDHSRIFRFETRRGSQLLNEVSASAALTTESVRSAASPPWSAERSIQ